MSYQQKNIIVSLITTLVLFVVYYSYMSDYHQKGLLDGPGGLVLVGKSVLWLIAASIAMTIIVAILFNILFAIATNDRNPSFTTDERDKLIDLKGLNVMLYVTGAGFILAMIALALGWQAWQVFMLIIASFALGDVSGNLSKMYFYSRGF